ncbi:unnamed protein product [Blepharisma stoltei]|uniref:Enamelin n=1 Tax=Blepharisma stoltei TaxID=1481888 RepID=A0AAU9IIV1_9CILI|nr:unnamed protein product [Blepharisma stoltei]
MSDSQFQYGVGHTSVKMHQPPGGSSSISLGWDEPSRPPVQRFNNAPPREPISNIFSNQQPPIRQEKNIFPGFQQNFPNFNSEPQLAPQQRDEYPPQDQFQLPMPNFKVDLYSQPPDPRPYNQPDMARNHFMKESPPNYYQRQQMSNNNQGLQNYSQPTRIEQVQRPEFVQRQEPMFQSPQMQRGDMYQRPDINQFPPVQRPDMFQREMGYQGAPIQRSGHGTRERPPDPYIRPNQYDPYQREQGYQPPQNYRQEEPRASPNYQQDFDMKPSVRVSNPPGGRSNFTLG